MVALVVGFSSQCTSIVLTGVQTKVTDAQEQSRETCHARLEAYTRYSNSIATYSYVTMHMQNTAIVDGLGPHAMERYSTVEGDLLESAAAIQIVGSTTIRGLALTLSKVLLEAMDSSAQGEVPNHEGPTELTTTLGNLATFASDNGDEFRQHAEEELQNC